MAGWAGLSVLPPDDASARVEEWKNSSGEKHREDGPAVVYEAGRGKYGMLEEWYLNGKLHRDDGPAVVFEAGRGRGGLLEQWRLNGELFREDGPAEVYEAGRGDRGVLEAWYLNGKRHREDVLAFAHEAGRGKGGLMEVWRLNGKVHRDEGPAVAYDPCRSRQRVISRWHRHDDFQLAVWLHSSETFLRVAFAWWIEARRRLREGGGVLRASESNGAGGAWWHLWIGMRRPAVAEVLAQLGQRV